MSSSVRRFALIWFALLISAPAFAQQQVTFRVSPPFPTTSDSVVIQLSGTWYNNRVPQNPSVSIQANQIQISTSPRPGSLPTLTPWNLTANVGRLAAGNRHVSVTYNGQEIGYASFLVTSNSGPTFQVTDLGVLGVPEIGGINASGRVAGYTTTYHAFFYVDGTLRDLGGVLAGRNSAQARRINDNGEVVGYAYNAGQSDPHSYRAFIWSPDPNKGVIDLGTLGGPGAWARDISPDGRVVGGSYDANGTQRGFIWSTTGGMQSKVGYYGDRQSEAFGINPSGRVVGWVKDASDEQKPFFSDGFGPQIITGVGRGPASDVNDAGQVVGTALMPQGSHAFLYNEGLTPIDLGTLGGDSSASAINKGGQVVGTAKVGNESHAFLWQNGVMKDLNDLAPAGWELEVANDINDAGQIVGYGRLYGGGPRRGFVLTPTATGPSVVVDWPTNYWGWFSDYSPVSGSYLVTYCSGSGVYSTATWDFSVPSGRHHVWVYIPSSSAPSRRTRQAQYTIRDLAGINSWRVTHHQQYQYSTLQSGWVDLGEFPFVGGLARVELVDETGEPTWSTFVVADAVGWS